MISPRSFTSRTRSIGFLTVTVAPHRESALRGESTIACETRTGDEVCLGAREIRHHAGDLLGVGVARQRHESLEILGERPLCRIHLGVHRTGLNGIDRDTARTEVTR